MESRCESLEPEPENVQSANDGKILLEWTGEEPCKAKARHVMKGYSEEGVDQTCYGLTDGPLAWYLHLRKLLVDKLSYTQALADPCIFLRHTTAGRLSGIIAVATDDLLYGGDEDHLQQMEIIKKTYKLGKYQFTNGGFTGNNFSQCDDGSILVEQEHYTSRVLSYPRNGKRSASPCARSTRFRCFEDVWGRYPGWQRRLDRTLRDEPHFSNCPFHHHEYEILSKPMPSSTREAKKHPKAGTRLRPIPPENVRIGGATDVSWANSNDKSFLEGDSKGRMDSPSHHTTDDLVPSGRREWTGYL